MAKAITGELATAKDELAQATQTYRHYQDMYDDLDRQERKAWGKATRDEPRNPAEWKRLSDMLVRTCPRVIATCGAMEQAKRRVARLSNGHEARLRVELANGRMGEQVR